MFKCYVTKSTMLRFAKSTMLGFMSWSYLILYSYDIF
jgi:hypothetical protein